MINVFSIFAGFIIGIISSLLANFLWDLRSCISWLLLILRRKGPKKNYYKKSEIEGGDFKNFVELSPRPHGVLNDIQYLQTRLESALSVKISKQDNNQPITFLVARNKSDEIAKIWLRKPELIYSCSGATAAYHYRDDSWRGYLEIYQWLFLYRSSSQIRKKLLLVVINGNRAFESHWIIGAPEEYVKMIAIPEWIIDSDHVLTTIRSDNPNVIMTSAMMNVRFESIRGTSGPIWNVPLGGGYMIDGRSGRIIHSIDDAQDIIAIETVEMDSVLLSCVIYKETYHMPEQEISVIVAREVGSRAIIAAKMNGIKINYKYQSCVELIGGIPVSAVSEIEKDKQIIGKANMKHYSKKEVIIEEEQYQNEQIIGKCRYKFNSITGFLVEKQILEGEIQHDIHKFWPMRG